MTSRNERCPCGSGKKFKRCCGQLLNTTERYYMTPRYRLTDADTHHFFVMDMPHAAAGLDDGNPLRNQYGKILVFLSRAAAIAFGQSLGRPKAVYVTIGMGDEKWKLFQAENEYAIVNEHGVVQDAN
jgi:hypothetical protein